MIKWCYLSLFFCTLLLFVFCIIAKKKKKGCYRKFLLQKYFVRGFTFLISKFYTFVCGWNSDQMWLASVQCVFFKKKKSKKLIWYLIERVMKAEKRDTDIVKFVFRNIQGDDRLLECSLMRRYLSNSKTTENFNS